MAVLLSLLLLCSVGCSSGSPGVGGGGEAQALDTRQATAPQPGARAAAPRVVLLPTGRDSVPVAVEVVYRAADRSRGLMYRKQLDADAGMLFIFETEQQLSFWMRNTYIALDMIFIKADMTILGIVENATPRTEMSRKVPGRSRYVLEVNAGFSRLHGLGPGTQVRFEDVPEPFGGSQPGR